MGAGCPVTDLSYFEYTSVRALSYEDPLCQCSIAGVNMT
jgi:hypothetical protein